MMRIFTVVAFIFAASYSGFAQTTLVSWTFDGATAADIPGGFANPTPVVGAGTISLIGGVTSAIANGNGSSDPVQPTGNNFSFEVTNFPAFGVGDRTAGVVIAASTAGFNSLKLHFDQRLSTTANNTWVVFFTSDVTVGSPVWVEAKVFTFTPAATGTGDVWYIDRTVDLSAFTELNDNTKAGLKIVSGFDPTAGNYLSAASNKTYLITGKTRLDLVYLTGIADVIVENSKPVASNVQFTGNLNDADTLRGTYSYADAEGDVQGVSQYSWVRADDGNGTNAVTIDGADLNYYLQSSNDVGKFIAYRVTPVAQTGTLSGEAVTSAFQGPVNIPLEVLLYPEAFQLSSGNYGLDTWASTNGAGTYPANMYFQTFTTEPASSAAVPSALWSCVYNNSSKARIVGLEDGGVGFINTSDPQSAEACGNGTAVGGYVGSAVVALNTLGLSGVVIHYRVKLVTQGNGTPSREYRLRPQYKVSGSLVWSDTFSGSEFTSAGKAEGDAVDVVIDATELNNQELVYLRWIYYQVDIGASGSRPLIALDNILIESSAITNQAPVANNVAMTGNLELGTQLTGTYDYFDEEGENEFNTTFQWYRGDNASGQNAIAIEGATTNQYTLMASDVGKYVAFGVTPVALTGTILGVLARSTFDGPVVDPTITGIADSPNKTDIYPIPTPGNLTVTGPDENPVVTIGIHTTTGQEVLNVLTTSKTTFVSLQGMKSGFYLLTLQHRNGLKQVRKVIKE